MEFLASFTIAQWAAFVSATLLIGMAKAGLDGGALIAMPIMAAAFGARSSSGLILGVLMTADLVAVWNYRKDLSVPHLLRTFPWAVVGIALGALIGGMIPEKLFRSIMAGFILVSVVLMGFREITGNRFVLPQRWFVLMPVGILAGFSSMVGNSAGALMGIYFLSSGLGKGNIIGTSVWFFFLSNIVKLPFHIFVWKTVSPDTLLADLFMAPVVILTTLLGVRLVRLIPEKPYRILIIFAALAGGILLFLR
jgi:uncharacterized membrane protein YfcA